MFSHLMLIYKVPESNERIAYVHSSSYPADDIKLSEKVFELADAYDLVIHRISSEKYSTSSIIQKDPFFEGITFYRDVDTFYRALDKSIASETVTSVDVAKYLLVRHPMDNQTLQKAVEIISKACLEQGIQLFDDVGIHYPEFPTNAVKLDPHEFVTLSKKVNQGPRRYIIDDVLKKIKYIDSTPKMTILDPIIFKYSDIVQTALNY